MRTASLRMLRSYREFPTRPKLVLRLVHELLECCPGFSHRAEVGLVVRVRPVLASRHNIEQLGATLASLGNFFAERPQLLQLGVRLLVTFVDTSLRRRLRWLR